MHYNWLISPSSTMSSSLLLPFSNVLNAHDQAVQCKALVMEPWSSAYSQFEKMPAWLCCGFSTSWLDCEVFMNIAPGFIHPPLFPHLYQKQKWPVCSWATKECLWSLSGWKCLARQTLPWSPTTRLTQVLLTLASSIARMLSSLSM